MLSAPIAADTVFSLSPQVVLEGFEEGALLLRLKDYHLFELNATAYFILARTDGQRTAAQIASALAEAFEIPEAEGLADTLALYEHLARQGVVEAVKPPSGKEENIAVEETMSPSVRYMRNPDVVLREEDEDGGLLFNPDTGQVKLVNPTGLFIWRQCDGSRNLEEIASALREAFEGAPQDRLVEDVRDFLKGMVDTGFIGIVEETAK